MQALQMIRTHPDVQGSVSHSLVRCIEECYSCAQVCLACADACLAEDDVDMLKQCIRLNQDCADICLAAGKLASRRTGSDEELISSLLEICALACRRCAEECEKHADEHEHCRICAESCWRCEEACDDALPEVH